LPALNEQRRQEIIETALRLFVERGYRATTMGDIAREMGCTKGLIYHYFPSKAALANQARSSSHEIMQRRLEAIACCTLTPTEKLRRAIEDFLTEILFGYQRYLVLAVDHADMPDDEGGPAGVPHREQQRRFVMLYRGIIAEGMADESFVAGDASLMANAVVQGIIGVARWWKPEGRLPPERIRGEMCEALIRMVRHPARATTSDSVCIAGS
jgi:AcrR family transcriptional regulator